MKKQTSESLRVAIVIDDLYPTSGGIARSVETQINELTRLGHRVTLIAPKHDLQKPTICETIVVPSLYVPGMPPYMCIVSFSRRTAKKISAQHQFDIIHSQTERGALILAAKLASMQHVPHIHSFHANLAGTHESLPFASFWGSMAYLLLINPLITMFGHKRFSDKVTLPVQNSDAPSFFARFDWYSLATIASRVDAYTTPALFMQQRINECSTGFSKNDGHVIPTGVNPAFSAAVGRAKRTRTDTIISYLCVSRLSKEKRVEAALRAFILADVPNSRLDIAGSGDQLNTLKKLAHSHDNIIFHDHISDIDELANLYINSDVFILPSYRFDTQALTLSEAAVAGLPIIYCDNRLDVGVKADNSLLATGPEPEALAASITQLSDQTLRQKMSASSRRIAQQLQPAYMAECYLKLYMQVHRTRK